MMIIEAIQSINLGSVNTVTAHAVFSATQLWVRHFDLLIALTM
jgi:hypothetical protein